MRSAGADELSDETIVDYLRRQGSATVGDLVDFTGVTATAVRQRLMRLMDEGRVARTQADQTRRGRPTHRYELTLTGVRSAGTNYDALAVALWDEVRNLRDPEVRQGLLRRLSERLAAACSEQVTGESSTARMASLAQLMVERRLPFVVDTKDGPNGQLPVLTALACPYPDLAERDRSVCAMEKLMFSSVVGEPLRLSACRLDGDSCCTFEGAGAAATPGSLAVSQVD